MTNNSRKFRFATKTEIRAATPEVSVTPAVLQYHPGVVRAWANFQGSGTVTLRESYNVSSITDVAVGRWNVNLATNMSTTTYCPTAGGSATSIITFLTFMIQIIDEGSFQIHSKDVSSASVDILNVYASALGNQ